MFSRWKNGASNQHEQPPAMNTVKPSPMASRTKSLRERFGSKRSYSENFKDPPVATTSPSKESCRNVRPSLPIIGVGPTDAKEPPGNMLQQQQQQMQMQVQQQQQKRQMNVLSEHYNPFAVLPEETYCSALDINSQEGDPRFPWQRDAAVQCDLSPTGEGYRYARKDSFYMMAKEASEHQERKPFCPTQSFLTPPPAPAREDQSGQTLADKFKEAYWHRDLSICNEEDETVPPSDSVDPYKQKKKKKTSVLQRALSERSRTRRLTAQQMNDENKHEQRQNFYSTNLSYNLQGKSESQFIPNSDPASGKTMTFSSAPTSRMETPPSDSSPQTPPSLAFSSPSRRNSDRRKRGFIRKNTNSAPDSFDNDDAYPGPNVPAITHSVDPGEPYETRASTGGGGGVSVGYFNFDSMQRLLDLSMTGSTKMPEKPNFLLTPGGLAVGKDKAGAYMTLPSPNVQNADEQDGPPNVFKKLSSQEDEESELEEADHAPPASALHRRRALVPPKMVTDDYESSAEDTDLHSPGAPPSPSDAGNNKKGRRSSIVVIPPMQICPGDLLVYSKALTQRNTLLDIDGSNQNLSGPEDTTRKAKNTWSLLRLFDRSNRGKSESLCGLEEVLSSLQPSEFTDEHLSKYKGMLWSEFVTLWECRTRRDSKAILRAQTSKWLSFGSMEEKFGSKRSSLCLPNQDSADKTSELSSQRSSLSTEQTDLSVGRPSLCSNHSDPQENANPDNLCLSTLDEIEHQIHNIGALTRSRNELKRREALWDLFQSECMFLYDHLMVLKNVFMEPLKKIQVEGFAMFAEPEVLFGNLDELFCVTYSFCKEFLSLILQNMNGDEVDTTDVLVKLFQRSSKANALTQAYHRYTLNYINALNYLETLRRQVEFNEFEKWCSRDTRCKKLQLTDLLVSPVQHVMRVPLLLKEIEMRTEEPNEKWQIARIIESEENSLRELDDKMKWLKNFERLLEIQRSIVWPSVSELDPKAFIPDFLKQPLAKQPCERLIVSPRRQIVLEGILHLLDSGKPSETFVLLFDDMLLITRRKKGLHKKKSSITENWASTCSNKNNPMHEQGYKYVVYKQPLSLDRFFIHDVNSQDGAANNLKNAFVLVCLNRFQQIVTVHTFQAPNETVKSLWLSKLRDTMDRWKRTLQNTVFRNQRTASNASATFQASSMTTLK